MVAVRTLAFLRLRPSVPRPPWRGRSSIGVRRMNITMFEDMQTGADGLVHLHRRLQTKVLEQIQSRLAGADQINVAVLVDINC